ncbi:MAG: hypothetical protein JO276_03105 [Sphingomonadaceae bacterium]|nr:hypothetical protein [Sphingomonadaceae bacterium]
MSIRAWAACLIVLAASGAPASAQQQAAGADDILSHVISVPNPRAYRVDGTQNGASSSVRSDGSVQGGKALRVQVPGRSAQTWETAVSVPINRAVHSGDHLVLAFWARLEQGENGATSASLPYNSVQLSTAPYTALFSGPVTITPQWQMFEIDGQANRDYAADALNVSIHLATGHQTIDIGPVFVLDMGQ